MTQADDIRRFVVREYIEPARAKGLKIVKVRVGDVNAAMGLDSRQPAIAGALGALKFLSLAKVKLIDRKGPHQGANLVFTFELV
jgi:5-methylcytosine-specific restriction protein B